MLGFVAAKSKHPLADAKELRLALEAITAHEPQDAVDETQVWLESLSAAEDLKLEQLLDLILRLDETVLPQARRLARDYVTAKRMSRNQEYRWWNTNFSYWKQVTQAYALCARRHAAGEKGANQITHLLPVLLARQLNAYAACLKWTQLRYGPQNSELWQGIGQAYLTAAAARLDREPLVLYPGQAETTIEQEYLKTLVLHASSLDKLRPMEVELAYYLIPYLLPTFSFNHEVRPENVYWVDAAKSLPPTRLAKLPETSPSLRFIAAGKTVDMLKTMQERIDATHQVPAELNLGGQYPAPVVSAVLTHLMRYWRPVPPTRNHQRHRVASRLSVVHGLAAVHASLQNELVSLNAEREEWTTDDVSMGGMGAQIQIGAQTRDDWVCVGALVGIQPEGGDNWLIAVVRRFSRDSERQGAVGLETLTKNPLAIQADCSGLPTEALLLDPIDTAIQAQSVRVVLSEAAFEEGYPLLFAHQGKSLRLHAQEAIERGLDFVVAHYQVEWVLQACTEPDYSYSA